MAKQRVKTMILLGLTGFTVVIIMVFFSLSAKLVYRNCFAEAGTVVEAKDFARYEGLDITFWGDEQQFDIYAPGEYPVKLRYYVIPLKSILTIRDTISPVASVHDRVIIKPGGNVQAEDFVDNVKDITKTKISFTEQPIMDQYGVQELSVEITDSGGNKVSYPVSLEISPVVDELICEAGDKNPVEKDFLYTENEGNLKLISDLASIDMQHICNYMILFRDNEQIFSSKLCIHDTIAPSLEIKNVEQYCKHSVCVEDFVMDASDVTGVTLSMFPEPDITIPGTQKVEITAIDAAGNQTTKNAMIVMKEDTEPPRINGVKDKTIFVGDGIYYRDGVSVNDNSGDGVNIDIDTGGANNSIPGQYVITYSATDLSGNSTIQTAVLTVKPLGYDKATIDSMADGVLVGIIRQDMGDRQKLDAIYNWVNRNIAYVSSSKKVNWLQGAFDGLHYRRGDCWVFYSTAKELLTRAGIANLDIQKLPGYKTMHYWNLVNIGEGWRHFDTCPRHAGGRFCYLTNEEMMAYSVAHNNSHIFDVSLYSMVQ